ncbi:hypothetical protein C7S15_7681 [Burkholderia cepacia]|nr:hypothetical protein [Burkholderia cepacia]
MQQFAAVKLLDQRMNCSRFSSDFSKQSHRSNTKSRIIDRPDASFREPAFLVTEK